MKRFTFSAVGTLLGATSLAAGVLAQTPQTPSESPAQQMTITGCVQREADYRSAKDAGKGGVAGTGVGAGNEFVLVNASAKSAGATAGTAGTSGGGASTARDTAYELTGSNEGQASAFVGKRVEITGTLKAAETSAAGRPTGGATAGEPPRGVDVMSKDLKLRELEVSSVREATGSCPAQP
jgi:hypothetical protein